MHKNLTCYTLLSAFIFFFSISSLAQYEPKVWNPLSGNARLESHPVTAIVLRADRFLGESIELSIKGEFIAIPFDPDGVEFSYFKSLNANTLSNDIDLNQLPDGINVNFIYSGNVSHQSIKNNERAADDCEYSFEAVPQSTWRDGLPEPNYNRSFTDVTHVVIHHSAGSNTDQNYTQVVRDVYLYHTQSNGWSDIGYNYLIAQDGTIFAGRDPGTGEQDNVRGAHFCGGNTGTMGICLLGNYETANPTSSTLTSLENVVGFKINKEELDPYGTYSHAFGNLGSILGHRDGCSTLCPGQNVYDIIPNIRKNISEKQTTCDNRSLAFFSDTRSPHIYDTVTFQNQSTGYDAYIWVLSGSADSTATWTTEGSVQYVAEGLHDVHLIGLLDDSPLDTLTKTNYIEVKELISIIPNMIEKGASFSVKSNLTLSSISAVSMEGKIVQLFSSGSNQFNSGSLKSGTYILEIPSSENTTKQRIFIK